MIAGRDDDLFDDMAFSAAIRVSELKLLDAAVACAQRGDARIGDARIAPGDLQLALQRLTEGMAIRRLVRGAEDAARQMGLLMGQ